MKSGFTVGFAGALRAVSVAAALACGAGASMANDATLKITSFDVTVSGGLFAWTVDAYQSYAMTALQSGGLFGTQLDSYSAANWNQGANRLAQTANAKATGNTVNFTDAPTQLMTGGFNLAAQATGGTSVPPQLPNSADASGLQQGAFVLLDENGDLAAGSITFDVYYAMSVAATNNSASNYAQTVLNFDTSSDAGGKDSFVDGLLSSTLPGNAGSSTGHFTVTYNLAAGDGAYYTLSGSAVAVAAVPEPSTYALMAIGLAGIGAVARRRRDAA